MVTLSLTIEEADDVKSAVMSRLLILDSRIRHNEIENPGWSAWLRVRREDRERAINIFLLIDNAIRAECPECGGASKTEETYDCPVCDGWEPGDTA